MAGKESSNLQQNPSATAPALAASSRGSCRTAMERDLPSGKRSPGGATQQEKSQADTARNKSDSERRPVVPPGIRWGKDVGSASSRRRGVPAASHAAAGCGSCLCYHIARGRLGASTHQGLPEPLGSWICPLWAAACLGGPGHSEASLCRPRHVQPPSPRPLVRTGREAEVHKCSRFLTKPCHVPSSGPVHHQAGAWWQWPGFGWDRGTADLPAHTYSR